jgi:hypothetical protein
MPEPTPDCWCGMPYELLELDTDPDNPLWLNTCMCDAGCEE